MLNCSSSLKVAYLRAISALMARLSPIRCGTTSDDFTSARRWASDSRLQSHPAATICFATPSSKAAPRRYYQPKYFDGSALLLKPHPTEGPRPTPTPLADR